jgi:hypothetical protein
MLLRNIGFHVLATPQRGPKVSVAVSGRGAGPAAGVAYWRDAIAAHPYATFSELVIGLETVAALPIPYARLPRRAYNVYLADFRCWSDIATQTPDSLLSRRNAGDDEVGDDRAGRLVAPDDGVGEDDEEELFGREVGIDGGAASAEEAAVHVIDG